MNDVVRPYIARLQAEATAAKDDLDAARHRLMVDLDAVERGEALLSSRMQRLRVAIVDDDSVHCHELKPSPRWW